MGEFERLTNDMIEAAYQTGRRDGWSAAMLGEGKASRDKIEAARRKLSLSSFVTEKRDGTGRDLLAKAAGGCEHSTELVLCSEGCWEKLRSEISSFQTRSEGSA